MAHLPAALVNKRINILIGNFFEQMHQFFEKRGWIWNDCTHIDNHWKCNDYEIKIIKRYPDGAYSVIKYIIRNTPSYYKKPKYVRDLSSISFEHIFLIYLPREYPASISEIKLRMETSLYHPRVSSHGSLRNVCYVVMGELDRILEDLIFFILLKHDRIRPPALYPREDFGLNSEAMKWYQSNYKEIETYLEELWDKQHSYAIENDKKKGFRRQDSGGIVFVE
ncbi:MAG: hypothetical protein ACP6IS_03500 [Candidatus Asgardarchaeia archaeon]